MQKITLAVADEKHRDQRHRVQVNRSVARHRVPWKRPDDDGRQSTFCPTSTMTNGIIVSDEVRRALAEGAAVVALESTIVSHGMPFPQNLDTALRVEAVVRKHDAVPATIAILDGVPHVGLSQTQLRRVAELGHRMKKCARRDLAYVLALKLNGATTVAATMYLAHQVRAIFLPCQY